MALVELSGPFAHRSRRQAERKPLSAIVQCRRGITREAVEVLDISRTGARIHSLSPLRSGHVVWLRLPGLEAIQANVVWTRQFEAGCEFVRPLHPAVFEIIARHT